MSFTKRFVMKEYNTIELSKHNGIANLSFNRPDLLNAMNRTMMDEIIDALESIVNDAAIRVAVITGKGKAFMAGADLKEYAAQTAEQFESFQQKGIQLYRIIENADIPFIAAINGFALGGGFEFALSCDFIIAAGSAKMGLPEVHLGLIPGGGGTQRLLQKVGLNRVKEMLLLGQAYPASHMHNWGIVNIVVEENAFMDAVNELAEKLKRRPAQSLTALKKMLQPTFIEQSFMNRLDSEGESVMELFYTPTARELIKAFTEKNK
jgi:enoyl-CoA hydratase/carnithine racemase